VNESVPKSDYRRTKQTTQLEHTSYSGKSHKDSADGMNTLQRYMHINDLTAIQRSLQFVASKERFELLKKKFFTFWLLHVRHKRFLCICMKMLTSSQNSEE